jgi:pimeloyl-ACP methyl ester carboxylesterase
MTVPEVKYAQNGGVNIAYCTFGDGPRDLILICGTMSHLELWWTDPLATAMLERLSAFSRVILFDKPGTGLSDPVPAAPTIEQRTADLIAVLDAARSERAVVVGYSEGGFPATLLAATRPQRVEALVLLDTLVACDWKPDVDVPPEEFARQWVVLDEACARWGEGVLASELAPTWVANPAYRSALPAIERACMSPGMAQSVLQGYHGFDVRDAAASVHVPTLVLHCEDERWLPVAFGRDFSRRIPGAVFVPLTGPDHFVWIHNSETVPEAIEEFVTGARRPRDTDRVLTTIVFTDIVDSTRRLAATGDARWRALLGEHDRRLDELLERFDGSTIQHTGDGRLVHFARPARAIRFATAMTDAARSSGLEIRAGVHTGECELIDGALMGLAVHIAARVAATAEPGEVLVSSTVKDLVIGSGLSFIHRGEHSLKGAPGVWALYAYDGDRPGPLLASGYETDVRQPVPLGEIGEIGPRPLRTLR